MSANVRTAPLSWRKSSYSGGGNNCVEVALPAGEAAVRDTKNRSAGTLTFTRAQWHGFLAASARLGTGA
ncbi:hypothetical protein JOF53_005817 [Crossiella equi]|uniref:DUF397 domain-containing protein n=1 Tax=Crossiella equi TaxID=130796 RepID=A0ABS5AK47_9PSEU|nr:DUF397 domain-containing protein [Crossiella equi]MBP2476945.1 hypothetical protein [Crossiella equi]